MPAHPLPAEQWNELQGMFADLMGFWPCPSPSSMGLDLSLLLLGFTKV